MSGGIWVQFDPINVGGPSVDLDPDPDLLSWLDFLPFESSQPGQGPCSDLGFSWRSALFAVPLWRSWTLPGGAGHDCTAGSGHRPSHHLRASFLSTSLFLLQIERMGVGHLPLSSLKFFI